MKHNNIFNKFIFVLTFLCLVFQEGIAHIREVELNRQESPPLVATGLLAYYTFDDDNCNDFLGEENYSGILQGKGAAPTFTTDIPGSAGKAMKCTKGKYYYLTKCPDFTNKSITYSVWLKTTKGGGVYQQAGYNNSRQNRKMYLYNNKVWFDYDDSFDMDIAMLVLDGKWHHVSITTVDNKTFKLYIDARYISTRSSSPYYNYGYDAAVIGEGFIGLMDNLRIYNRALSQEEIREIYKAKQ